MFLLLSFEEPVQRSQHCEAQEAARKPGGVVRDSRVIDGIPGGRIGYRGEHPKKADAKSDPDGREHQRDRDEPVLRPLRLLAFEIRVFEKKAGLFSYAPSDPPAKNEPS